MQRDEFVQQLWLEYVHAHPECTEALAVIIKC